MEMFNEKGISCLRNKKYITLKNGLEYEDENSDEGDF
jgi:hypothetical protein